LYELAQTAKAEALFESGDVPAAGGDPYDGGGDYSLNGGGLHVSTQPEFGYYDDYSSGKIIIDPDTLLRLAKKMRRIKALRNQGLRAGLRERR
jgi:hypothetical protein